MAREKVTIMADRDKVARAQRMTGAKSASDVIDAALDHLLRTERLRSDIAAYTATPPTSDEIAIAAAASDAPDLADDTDWVALYSDG